MVIVHIAGGTAWWGLSNLTKAIIVILFGIFSFDLMSLIVKLFSNRYDILQISVLRNLFGFIPPLAVVFFSIGFSKRALRTSRKEFYLSVSRAISICFAQVCFYTALAKIEFAIAITLAFVGPFFVTALSIPVLGLKVGVWRWGAILLGFVGVLMVMRPGFSGFSIFYLCPVGAALGYAVSSILVRLYYSTTDSGIIQLHTQIYTLIFSLLIMYTFIDPVPIQSLFDGALFLASGLFGGIGVLCLIACYRMTEPSQIAPFEYFSIPISFFLGWYFFSEAPLDRLFPGVFIIISSGLVIIWRENYNKKIK